MRLTKYLGINPEIKNEIYDKIVLNNDVNSKIDKIRNLFEIPDPENLKDGDFVSLLENKKIQKEAEKIISDFNLPKNWVEIVHRYIVDGDFITNHSPDDLTLEIIEKKSGHDFYLKINPKTSLDDIKNIWFLIKKEFKKYGYPENKKKRKLKFNRDEEIYNLKIAGKSYAQIALYIEDKYGDDLTFENIKTIYFNRLKSRKGKK